jgi:hypothetical protein
MVHSRSGKKTNPDQTNAHQATNRKTPVISIEENEEKSSKYHSIAVYIPASYLRGPWFNFSPR